MTRRWCPLFAAILLSLAVTACDGGDKVAEAPPPEEYGGEAIGYFCQMLLSEHGGPKGQVHLASRDNPLWFSSVRDTVAFTLLESEPRDIAAIYVNDMGKATDWAEPEPGTWVDARAAWYVLGSSRLGGMGLPEVVPFGSREAAERFAGDHGGRIARLAEIPPDYVLGMPEAPQAPGENHATH